MEYAVSCIDVAMPMIHIHAEDFGKTGHEFPAELDSDKEFMARVEKIRRQAGVLMGLGDAFQTRCTKGWYSF
jgi:2-methylaconitate cis-trans-isomerase PrpF